MIVLAYLKDSKTKVLWTKPTKKRVISLFGSGEDGPADKSFILIFAFVFLMFLVFAFCISHTWLVICSYSNNLSFLKKDAKFIETISLQDLSTVHIIFFKMYPRYMCCFFKYFALSFSSNYRLHINHAAHKYIVDVNPE